MTRRRADATKTTLLGRHDESRKSIYYYVDHLPTTVTHSEISGFNRSARVLSWRARHSVRLRVVRDPMEGKDVIAVDLLTQNPQIAPRAAHFPNFLG